MPEALEGAQNPGALRLRQTRSREHAFRVDGPTSVMKLPEILNNGLRQDVVMLRDLLGALTGSEKLADLPESDAGWQDERRYRECRAPKRTCYGKGRPLTRNERLLFSVEDIPALGREMQAAELEFRFEQTRPDELLRPRSPLLGGILFADAEDTQLVVPPRQYFLRPRAAQHRDDMRRPEALAGQLHAGKELLGSGCGVGQVTLHGLHTGVTAAAGLPERLAEVGQQRFAAAITRLREAHQRLQPCLPSSSFTLGALIDEMAVDYGVAAAVKQQAIRPLAIPPRTANLLIIALQVLGEVSVNDEPDVGLVDAHPERNGRHHQRRLVVKEALLVAAAHGVFQAGVIRQGGPAVRVERGAQLIGLLACTAVDNVGLAAEVFSNTQPNQ